MARARASAGREPPCKVLHQGALRTKRTRRCCMAAPPWIAVLRPCRHRAQQDAGKAHQRAAQAKRPDTAAAGRGIPVRRCVGDGARQGPPASPPPRLDWTIRWQSSAACLALLWGRMQTWRTLGASQRPAPGCRQEALVPGQHLQPCLPACLPCTLAGHCTPPRVKTG